MFHQAAAKAIFATLLLLTRSGIPCLGQASVNYSGGLGGRDVVYNGAPVPDGNYAAIGFFNSGFDLAANSANLPALKGAWNQFGFTQIRTLFGRPGSFSDFQALLDLRFQGQKISLWIFDTANNTAPTASFDNVSGYGIYSSTLVNWAFPSPNAMPPGNTTAIDSSEVNQAWFGTFDPSHLVLAPVPEPSVWSLFVVGSLLFCGRRLMDQRRASYSR